MPVTKKQPTAAQQDKLNAALRKRWDAAVPNVTPDNLARGHTVSLEIYKACAAGNAPNEIWYCSRRAAKTETALGVLLLTSILNNDRSSLYLGLTDFPVLKVRRRWLKLLKKFAVPCKHLEKEAAYETEFPNGSRVVFGTTSTRAHIQNYLGDSMGRGSVAIIDESQSQGNVIKEIVEEILGPMIAEKSVDDPEPGRIIVAGTAVDSAGGYFDSLYERSAVIDGDGRLVSRKADATWLPRSWSIYANPYFDGAASEQQFCKDHHYEPTDPFILQIYRGWRVFNANATAYRYSVERNRYTAPAAPWAVGAELAPGKLVAVLPPSGIDIFACGIDAGSHDRTGVVLWGWDSHHKERGIFQVAEWSTERHTPVTTTQLYAVLKVLKQRYGRIIRFIRDDGSSQTVDDSLRVEHGITLEPPTKGKGSKRARVDRLADLLSTNRAHVLEGSALETDLILTRWDHAKRSEGKWFFDDSIIHPDVGDAGTYALEGTYVDPPGKQGPAYATEAEAIQAETLAAFYKAQRTKPVHRERPRTSSSLWTRVPR